MDDLKTLNFTELCFLYLQDQLEHRRDANYRADESRYYKELLLRLGVDSMPVEECANIAKNKKLITELEYKEITTAIRIKSISEKALDRLKQDR